MASVLRETFASVGIAGTGTIAATAIGGQRQWTYDADAGATYDGVSTHSYDSDREWTYEPVNG